MGTRLHCAMPSGTAATVSDRPRLYPLKKRANCAMGCGFPAFARRFAGGCPFAAFGSSSEDMFLLLIGCVPGRRGSDGARGLCKTARGSFAGVSAKRTRPVGPPGPLLSVTLCEFGVEYFTGFSA